MPVPATDRRAVNAVTKGDIAEQRRRYNRAVNRQLLWAAFNCKVIVDRMAHVRHARVKCGGKCPSCARALANAEAKRIRRRLKRLLVAKDFENFERVLLSLGHVTYVEQILGLQLSPERREELSQLMLAKQKEMASSDRLATKSD